MKIRKFLFLTTFAVLGAGVFNAEAATIPYPVERLTNDQLKNHFDNLRAAYESNLYDGEYRAGYSKYLEEKDLLTRLYHALRERNVKVKEPRFLTKDQEINLVDQGLREGREAQLKKRYPRKN
jgi:hypothetical protein